MARIKSLRDRYVGLVKDSVEDWPASHRVMANAHFIGPDTLKLTPKDGFADFTVKAKRIVIATGSGSVLPDSFDKGPNVITSDDVFDWDDLPKSVLVFGAGVLFASIGRADRSFG
jgi:dihydrolipoamide dehydrogenase